MPISENNLALLSTTFDSLPPEVQAVFNAESTPDILSALAKIIGDRRTTGMQGALGSIISGPSVLNWGVMDQLKTVADGATVRVALESVKAKLDAHDNNGLGTELFAFVLAALKHFGLE